MNRLQNRLVGPASRQFSPNSSAIRSQILENLDSNSQFFVSARQDRQTPRAFRLQPHWVILVPLQSFPTLSRGSETDVF
ncbi:MAG: hypothetical protein BA869_11475 [Desulfuromonadales bacterium C00003107]|nr:MAG: hypothetical protein BA869_11475 [Desulfuromonadales bacterium C00003107]